MLKTGIYKVAIFTLALPCSLLAADLETGSNIPSMSSYSGKIVFSMLLIIGLMLALAWFSKRFNFPGVSQRNNGEIQTVAQLNLGPRERVLLLQVGDDQVLVSAVPGEIRKLMVMRDKGSKDGAAQEFANALEAERLAAEQSGTTP